jgi:glycosyltransferase involved in cell wall biosynthesis
MVPSAPSAPKPVRVAFVADTPNWAFHKIAREITPHLRPEFECDVYFSRDYDPEAGHPQKTWRDLLLQFRAGRYDLVHFLWRDAPWRFLHGLSAFLDLRDGPLVSDWLVAVPLTTSVYDQAYLDVDSVHRRTELFRTVFSGYVVSSQILDELYRRIGVLPAPDGVVEDGVDQQLFRPRELARLAREGGDLVVGWAGNSQWSDGTKGKDHKGLETIIKPAIRLAQTEGVAVRGRFQDRNDKWLPYEQMPDYFNALDVYVCASEHEGTPNPVLEAMACGLPVVSTRVGVVPQVFGPLQSRFILEARTPEALAACLVRLAHEPQLRTKLSEENLRQIKGWNWERTADRWRSFFANVVGQVARGDGRRNRYYAQARRRYWEALVKDGTTGYFDLLYDYRRLKARWDELQTSRAVRLAALVADGRRRLLRTFGRRSA